MEPPVPAVGQGEGELLVLDIVLSDIDMESVGRQKMQRLALRFFFLPAAFSATYYTNNSNDISQQIST